MAGRGRGQARDGQQMVAVFVAGEWRVADGQRGWAAGDKRQWQVAMGGKLRMGGRLRMGGSGWVADGRHVADGRQWVGCGCVESCTAVGSSKVQVGGDVLQQAVEAVGSGAA